MTWHCVTSIAYPCHSKDYGGTVDYALANWKFSSLLSSHLSFGQEMYSKPSLENCGSKILPPVFLLVAFFLRLAFKGCELFIVIRIFFLIMIFNVPQTPFISCMV